MSLVYIVRHGNTFDRGDTVLRVGGRTDLPLATSGTEQAIALSEAFKSIEFARAFSSDLRRTKETASIILEHHAIRLELTEFLREIDYGPDEGRPETEVISRVGAAALQAWDDAAIPPQGWHVNPAALRKAWAAFLDFLPKTGEPTLVVTSNGIARFILDVAQTPPNTPRKLRTGAYGIVELGDTPKVIAWDVRPA